MPLPPIIGHSEAQTRVANAIRRGRMPQTLLITGASGVGKQRFALWAAQALVCAAGKGEETTGKGAGTALPCGQCLPCRKVLGLVHPDVHWMVPIPRPKAGDPEKQVDEAAEAIGEVLAERRERPFWTAPDGMAIHGVATARLILRRAILTSVEGGPKVFLIGGAERLVPQESSPEAANALLKLIEEPPRETYFLLTASDPARLLPTIRSRTVPLRLGGLDDREVREFLTVHLSPAPKGAELEALIRRAEGSIGRALSEDSSALKARQAALDLLAGLDEGRGRWMERVLTQAPWQARGEFSDMLAALGPLLEDRARGLSEDPGGGSASRMEKAALAMERVRETWEAAQGNVNPQLLLAVLADDLEETLCR